MILLEDHQVRGGGGSGETLQTGELHSDGHLCVSTCAAPLSRDELEPHFAHMREETFAPFWDFQKIPDRINTITSMCTIPRDDAIICVFDTTGECLASLSLQV